MGTPVFSAHCTEGGALEPGKVRGHILFVVSSVCIFISFYLKL